MSAERRWQLRIDHMLSAIGRIQQYVAGMTEEQFAAESMALDAVIRNFQVLGEAVRHVPAEVQSKYTDVPWRLIEGMRHILVHDYFAVKVDVVWRTIHQSLPPLIDPQDSFGKPLRLPHDPPRHARLRHVALRRVHAAIQPLRRR